MKALIAIGFIFALVVAGILVDRLYRRFAATNPELGPFRPEGKQDCAGCVAGSGCADKAEATACTAAPVAPIELHRH